MTEPQREPRYFNRELSWLAFNRRVLEEASNPAHPLLERLRFLSISGSNLDEFFMVRVAGLKGQELQGIALPSADGLSPKEQLAAIATGADRLIAEQEDVLETLLDALQVAGITLLESDEIDAPASEWLEQHFREQLYPVLTPQALDPSLDEAKVTVGLTRLDAIWDELFPVEQHRLVSLLVEKVVVSPNELELRLRTNGIERVLLELNTERCESKVAA